MCMLMYLLLFSSLFVCNIVHNHSTMTKHTTMHAQTTLLKGKCPRLAPPSPIHHHLQHALLPHQPHTRTTHQPRTIKLLAASPAASTPTTNPAVQQPPPIIDPAELCSFITNELQDCFKPGGSITTSGYTTDFVFQDPLVTLPAGPQYHQLQLDAFKTFFNVTFVVLSCTQNPSDPLSFDVRWSMRCVVRLAPWRPPVQLTGASVITVDPLTGRLATQRDIWDGVEDIPAPSVLWGCWRTCSVLGGGGGGHHCSTAYLGRLYTQPTPTTPTTAPGGSVFVCGAAADQPADYSRPCHT